MEFLETSPSRSVVLGKRTRTRRLSELVLHLSGGSRSSQSPVPTVSGSESGCESEYVLDASSSKASGRPVLVNGKLVRDEKRIYRCTHEGCGKKYKKPSRLEEHERSHTGERPFVCSTCSKSYLRESHLQAHVRSHLPESARPLACGIGACNKRFWTAQHLRAHEELHTGEKPFKCTIGECDFAFSKHSQLRGHVAVAHCAPGTKPFRCEHDGCTKSFTTGQKLRAHTKTHDGKRYTCVHPVCIEQPATPYFGTWTALQAHMRTSHPAVCPYASCKGKSFSAQKGLRAHLTLHEQREIEEELDCAHGGDNDGDDSVAERPRKRRRGGEVGRDWKCEADGCEKDFKSKKAMTTHFNVAHLQRRDFICHHTDCALAYGYKHLLQRHLAKVHAQHSSDEADSDVEGGQQPNGEKGPEIPSGQWSAIDALTGKGYADRATERLAANKGLRCPFPDISAFSCAASCEGAAFLMHSVGRETGKGSNCDYVFSRAYDLRRHFRTAHAVEVEKEEVEEWVRRKKEAASGSL